MLVCVCVVTWLNSEVWQVRHEEKVSSGGFMHARGGPEPIAFNHQNIIAGPIPLSVPATLACLICDSQLDGCNRRDVFSMSLIAKDRKMLTVWGLPLTPSLYSNCKADGTTAGGIHGFAVAAWHED